MTNTGQHRQRIVMNRKPWDPLAKGLPEEVLSATLKRQIKNILKSYTGWYDPLSELIQNALDGVDERRKSEPEFEPRIWVLIDLKENLICVTDNGTGFSEANFESFLAPNVSFKTGYNRGNKGVGATYLAYGFNELQIGTKTPDYEFIGTITKGREWVEDESGTVMRPVVTQSEAIHDAFQGVDRGTTFSLRLIGEHIRPRNLKWVSATIASQWATVLRIKTPLGGIYPGDYKTPLCFVRVINEIGESSEVTIDHCGYLYPNTVVSACKSLDDIRSKQKELLGKGRDPSKLPDSYFRLNGLYNFWNCTEFIEGEFKTVLNDEDKALLAQFNTTVYGFFCYSTDIWDTFNDNFSNLRRGARILRGGLQLAANSMPQGELLTIPLKRNIGYQNVAHIIVHYREADPDLGRKGFQPELVQLAEKISVAVVGSFQNYRSNLKKETGAPPDIIQAKNVYDWVAEQEEHEKRSPLVITRKDVFLPTNEPSISSTPLNEQDVVSLFNQLLAGGVIRSIRILATSQHQQYDGVFRFVQKDPLTNYTYDPERNPLGVLPEQSRVFTSEPRIMEYKYTFDALIEEFEKEEKSERQINLLIAWVMGDKWQRRYEITPLLHLDNLHHRWFHGGTHIIKNSSTNEAVFPAIILSELVAYVNDVDTVQDYHRTTYMA